MFRNIRTSVRIFIFFGTPLFIAVICFLMIMQQNKYDDAIVTKNNIKEKIASLNNDLNNMSKVNDEYITKNLKIIFSGNDLFVFANRFWKYELLVNNVSVKSSKMVATESNGIVKVTLKETKEKTELPLSIISHGSVTGGDASDSAYKHITIRGKSILPVKTINGQTETDSFEIKNAKKGDIYKVVLSDQLIAKLGISFNIIEVTVK